MYRAAVSSVGYQRHQKEFIQSRGDMHTEAAVLLTVLTVSRVSGDGSWRSAAGGKKKREEVDSIVALFCMLGSVVEVFFWWPQICLQ